jgi:phage terminase large subunit
MQEYYWDSKEQGRQKTDKECADDLEVFMGKPNDAVVIVDPSAASFKAELTQRGIWHVDADNEVLDGIRTFSVMLSTKRYHVHEQCVHTIEEIPSYSWNDKKAVNQGIEEPVKKFDDICDAARYIVKTMIPSWRLSAA